MLLFEGHTRGVVSLAFSADSSTLSTLSQSGGVIEFDAVGTPSELPPEIVVPDCLGILPDGSTAVGCWKGLVPLPPDRFEDVPGHSDVPMAGFAVLDRNTLAVGYGSRVRAVPGRFGLYDLVRKVFRAPQFTERDGVRAVAAFPPTKTVAWANGSLRVTVWDTTRQTPTHLNQTHSSPAIAFGLDGTALAAAIDYNVAVYDLADRRNDRLLKGHKGKVTAVAFSPDGRTLATAGWDETVRIWDAATGSPLTVFQWPIGKVYSLAYSPDGTRLAAGGQTGKIAVWDVE